MRKTVHFTILGEPQGKGRPKFARHGNYVTTRTPDETVFYENLVKTEYRNQTGGVRFNDDSPIGVSIAAFYSIPKSASKKKREAMLFGKILPLKKPDADNITKVICDSLNGIAFRDDSQVTDTIVEKRYDIIPRVEVSMTGEVDE